MAQKDITEQSKAIAAKGTTITSKQIKCQDISHP